MKKLMTIALLVTAGLSQAAPVCRIADAGNHNPVPVKVTLSTGAQLVPTQYTQYAGHTVSVSYVRGDQYDPQTLLSLTVDGVTSRVYNVSAKSLYTQSGPDYLLQCSFRNE